MKNVQRTLAAALALGIACFCCRAYGVSLAITVPTASALVVASFFYTFFSSGKKSANSFVAAFLAAAFCVLGFFGGSALFEKQTSAKALISDDEHVILCRAEEILYSESYGSAMIAGVSDIDGESVDIKVYLSFPFENEFYTDDIFTATGSFCDVDAYSSLYESDGVYIAFDADAAEYVSAADADIFDKINDFKFALSAKLSQLVGGDEGALAAALTLGDRSGVTSKIKLDFRRAGASHLIAISGMHLSVIIMSLHFMLRAAGRVKRNIILIAITLFYMALTGFSPSVCRAGIMMTLYLISDMIGEKSDGLTSLFIAMTIIIAIWPNSVYNAGLWLSCSATFGILVVAPAFKMTALMPKKDDGTFKKIVKGVLRQILTLMIAGAAAQMFTLPVLFASFGGVSAFAVVSGLILIPLAELALVLSLLTCVLSFVPIISSVIAALAGVPLSAILALTERISSVEGAYISIKQPFVIYIIIVGAALTAAILIFKKLDRRLVLAVGAAAVIAFCVCLGIFDQMRAGDTDMIYSVTSTSESITVSKGGNVFVIDISTGGYSPLYDAVENVNALYSEEIDYLVLTHLHVNHISSLQKLLTYIKVNHIVIPTTETENDALVIRNITLTVGDAADIIFYNRAEESEIEVDGVTITLPRYVASKSSTHPVIALAIEENGHRVSYVGAAAVDAKNEYVNDIYQNSDCVIAGVHGPKTSTPLKLKYTASSVAVVGGDAENIDADGWDGELIYARDLSGRVHIKFENK